MELFPAKAGIQSLRRRRWTPAFAGEQGFRDKYERPYSNPVQAHQLRL